MVAFKKRITNNFDSPEYIFVHMGKTMDKDDPGISPALGKPPGKDKAVTPQSMMKRYKDNNELPYR